MAARVLASSAAADPAPSGDDRRRGSPLRVHLAGLVVLFVLAAALGVATGWWQTEQDALTAARADATFGARKAAEQVGADLATVQSTVAGLAANAGVRKLFADPASCQLAFTMSGGAEAGHLDVVRTDGTLVCSSRQVPAASAGVYRGSPWLSAAPGSAQVTAPVTDARTGRPAIRIAAVVPGAGLVVAFVDLVILAAGTGDVFGGARGLEFMILSPDRRTILTRWPDGQQWAGRPVAASAFRTPDEAGDGVDVTGEHRRYGHADTQLTGWRVYAGAARGPALAAAHRLALRQGVIVAVGLFAGLLATVLIYRRITRPINRLRSRVHRAAATGTLDTSGISGPREVGELTAAFATVFAAVDSELGERRKAEQQARQHERNYRQMFDASPYPICLVDVDTGRIVAANDAAVQYYGYPHDELLQLAETRLHADDDAAPSEKAAGASREGRQRHVTRDGTVTQVSVTAYPVSFAGRDTRCVVVQDITEREQLEQRLRQSERLESLGHLAGGIAHDFNNLLGIINGYASMSVTEVEAAAASDPAWRTLHDDLGQIVAAGDRAAALTRQLLAFARTDAAAEATVIDLNDVVADIDKLLQRTLGADIRLVTHLSSEPWPIRADAGRIEQVLVNLAVNARDAMPHGGTLTIDTDPVTADAHYAAQYPGLTEGRYMRLRVSDTGTGMDKATLQRAFEPFFTTKEKGHGTGLGLATIHGIITQAGGHAHIYSEPGHGTTVVALLPATDESLSALVPAATTTPDGHGETILLVEDEDQLRLLTERILRRAGYAVLAAAIPAEARLHAAGQHVDLLLTDVILPDLDGPTLAAEITAERPGIAVVYMSGYAETILATRSAMPPGATLLNKPLSAEQLLTAVTRALAASRPVPRG